MDSVYTSLEDAGMLDNTIIVFASDNGGLATAGGASNWPLRGQKVEALIFAKKKLVLGCVNSPPRLRELALAGSRNLRSVHGSSTNVCGAPIMFQTAFS